MTLSNTPENDTNQTPETKKAVPHLKRPEEYFTNPTEIGDVAARVRAQIAEREGLIDQAALREAQAWSELGPLEVGNEGAGPMPTL